MIATIEGMIVSNKADRNQKGQDFRSLQVMQIVNDEAELVKIKDFDLTNKDSGKPFNAKCDVNVWQMGGRFGVSIKVLEHVKESSQIKPVDDKKKAVGQS